MKMTDYSRADEAIIQKVEGYTFDTIPSKGHRPVIQWEYPEFQSLCPVSQRHDQGTLVLRYKPVDHILESKSMREYLSAWRNNLIWQEYVTDVIAGDVFEAIKPEWLSVEIEWTPRGGIYATTRAIRGNIKE